MYFIFMIFYNANIVETDQMPWSSASDLDLYFWPKSVERHARKKQLNVDSQNFHSKVPMPQSYFSMRL